MNHIEVFDRLESRGASVSKLFWIAVSLESEELQEFLPEMEGEAFKECFPAVAMYYKDYRRDNAWIQALTDGGYYGFLAEVVVDKCDDFVFDATGEPTVWSSSSFNGYAHYVYAETLEDLVAAIERVTAEDFAQDLARERKAKGIAEPVKA